MLRDACYMMIMFRFNPKSRLLARTKSGIMLGKVVAIEIDQSTGRIVNFLVASNRVFSVLSDKNFVINWSQVVDWIEDEIIVADATVRDAMGNVAMSPQATPPAQCSELT
jgi:sporulation protein YlmC with PRC-barrel domain